MNATDLLKKQHTKVDALFTRFEKAKKAADKVAIFEEIAANLVANDAIEREIFYPACEEEMGMTESLGEALVEHGLVEFMVYRADQNLHNETLDHHGTAMPLQLEHVLACVGMRSREEQRETHVDGVAGPIVELRQCRVTGFGQVTHQRGGDLGHLGP